MTWKRWLFTALSFAAVIGVSAYFTPPWWGQGTSINLQLTAHLLATAAVATCYALGAARSGAVAAPGLEVVAGHRQVARYRVKARRCVAKRRHEVGCRVLHGVGGARLGAARRASGYRLWLRRNRPVGSS